MISCTEFIPAYSELFKYIDQTSGREAVYKFWKDLFKPENHPLNHLIPKFGKLRACWENWYVVFTEEACDNTMLYNEEEGWWLGCMHHCPSKGRFQKLGYMEPFDEYCKHCDSYEIVLSKYGLKHCMDYRANEQAKCRCVIYDPEKFRGDPQEILDTMYHCDQEGCKFQEDPAKCPMNHPGTMTLHTTSEAYTYLHPDFHNSLARGVEYIAEHYGEQGLRDYLTRFTLAFHKPLLARISQSGLAAIEEYLRWLYDTELAPDALKLTRQPDGLEVQITFCPAVKHLLSRDITPHWSFERTTSIVYEVIAAQSGFGFEMCAYDHATGAARFRFYQMP